MTLQELLGNLRARPGVTEGYPFGPGPLVFKVGGKMFALVSEESDPLAISLKCDPERSVELRAVYSSIQPGYHLNKQHWNTLTLDGAIPDDEVLELIAHSYDLVFNSLPRAMRKEITGGSV